MCEAHRALYVCYIRTHHYYYYYIGPGPTNHTSQMTTQQTPRPDPMLVLRWASVADGGRT